MTFLVKIYSQKNNVTYTHYTSLIEAIVTYLSSHFHLIHFTSQSSSHSFPSIHLTYQIPSHSHLPYLVILIPHRISTSSSLSFFNLSRLWKLGVSLDKFSICRTYCIIRSWTPMVIVLMLLYKNHNMASE